MQPGRSVFIAALLCGIVCAVPARAETIKIEMKDLVVTPAEVTAKVGDTIVWENRDMFVHNVTGTAAGVNSGDLAPGKTWRYVVRAGTSFDYLCTLHPMRKGRVNVASPPKRTSAR